MGGRALVMGDGVDLGPVVRELRDRVARLEVVQFRAVVTVAVVAIAVGFVLPFLVASDPDEESLRLVTAPFALGAAGGGPFRGEAVLAAVVVGAFILLALVTLVVVARLLRRDVSARALGIARGFSVALLVGCGLAWLLVFALAGHFEGNVNAFSPALAALTAGAAVGIGVRHLAPR